MTTFIVTDSSNDHQLQHFIRCASDGDTITFARSGSIKLTSMLHLQHAGQIVRHVILDGSGVSVILDGGNLVRVLLVEGVDCTLKGLTIANGNAESGGGVLNRGGKVTLTDCTFFHNRATYGGGLANESGEITMTNCTFSENTASRCGGGLFNNVGEATIHRSTFANNSASRGEDWYTFGSLEIYATTVMNKGVCRREQTRDISSEKVRFIHTESEPLEEEEHVKAASLRAF